MNIPVFAPLSKKKQTQRMQKEAVYANIHHEKRCAMSETLIS